MKGSVFKRPGAQTWTMKYDLPRDANGKRRSKMQAGYRTEEDAQRALRKVLSQLDEGTFTEPTKRMFGEYLTAWLATLEVRGLRPSTRESYRMHVLRYIVPRLGGVALQRLAPADLNGLYADLHREGRLQRKGGLSARTVRYCHTIIRRALQDAVHQGLVSRNVASFAIPPSAKVAREDAAKARHVWSPEQLAAFLGHVREHRLCAAFVLLATTGARRGEILGLRWTDVDLDGARLTIAQTLVVANGEVQFGAPKTHAGRRTVALDPTSVTALREHRKRQIEERLALGLGQSELVFCREDGRPLQPSTFSNVFTALVASSGLPRIRCHDLRHTWASLALAAGVPAKNVSERLGHSGIAITLDIYTHTVPEQDERAAEAVASLVFGKTP